jgi:peptide/nickel transport system substrate-binding protein
MMRRLTLAIAIVAAALGAPQISRGETVLRFIPQADLRVLDPIWTRAYITRNHGYMVFDTLFGVDATFQPQPEMVERWEISPDKLVYTFSLPRFWLRLSEAVAVADAAGRGLGAVVASADVACAARHRCGGTLVES